MPDIKEIAPEYSYYYRGKRYNEIDIAIHNLNKCELAKLDRIWDCGSVEFTLNFKQGAF